MAAASLPDDEDQRRAALASLQILDTPPEERFDRITRLVAAHFAMPMVALNFIDAERQWTKSHIGMTTLEAPRASSFCAATILATQALCVPDTHLDARFRHTPMVTGSPYLRFYAGVPVRDVRGYAVGSLCVADKEPRMLTVDQVAQLHDFAALIEQTLATMTVSTAFLQIQATEDALRISEAQRRAVFESLHEGVMLQDPAGRFVLWNARALQLLGVTAAMVSGHTPPDVGWYTAREDGRPFPFAEHPCMIALQTGQAQFHVVMQVHTPNGSLIWLQINAQLVRDAANGTVLGVVSSFVDITHLKAIEQHLHASQRELTTINRQLTTLAMTDGLTGVLNRRALMERLVEFTTSAVQTATPLALLLIDVDHFKVFNDTFGHPAGDMVLHVVAQLLGISSRAGDLVARYGGEEFVVVLPHTHAAAALVVAERVRAAVAEHPWMQRAMTVSIGVAWLRAAILTGADLVRAADSALYQAKRQGRNQVVAMDD